MSESKIKKCFENIEWIGINPEKSIQMHFIFWLAIIVPSLVALCLCVLLYLKFGHCGFLNSCEGYLKLLEINKVPLYVLATVGPLTLIVIRTHSSKQTAIQ